MHERERECVCVCVCVCVRMCVCMCVCVGVCNTMAFCSWSHSYSKGICIDMLIHVPVSIKVICIVITQQHLIWQSLLSACGLLKLV